MGLDTALSWSCGCSATPKQFASVPVLKSSFHTKPSLPVPPFPTIHWESAFRLPAGCSALAPAFGTRSTFPEPSSAASLQHWALTLCQVLTEMRALGICSSAQTSHCHWSEGSSISYQIPIQTSPVSPVGQKCQRVLGSPLEWRSSFFSISNSFHENN